MKGNKVKLALAYKVYFVILISVAFCAVFIGTLNYYEDKESLSRNLGSNLERVARTAALSVSADSLNRIKHSEDYFYYNARNYLLDVKTHNDIKAPIYILKKSGKNKVSLLVTTEPGSMIGADYKSNPTLRRAFDTGRSSFSPIYTDKNGTWISAYAPIKDDKGAIAGVLELNNHIDQYMTEVRFRLLKIVLLGILGLLIGTILGIPLLRPVLNSINVLNIAAVEIEKGNYEYQVKLKSSDEIGRLADAFEKMRMALKDYVGQLEEALLNEKKAYLDSVKALSKAIAIREPHMKGHVERAARNAELIAKELGIPKDDIDSIKYGCMLHDLGKIGIDINILQKTSELTSAEYEDIKRHPDLGAQIIKGVEFLNKAREAILYHQERYDGKGYPKGLKGDQIPLSARITAIVDAYDAMVSDRPYRSGAEKDKIISKIKEESGKQFDPKVVEAFLKVADRL